MKILETSPFGGHTAVEKLTPTDRILFVDELLIRERIGGRVIWELDVAEPSTNAIAKNIREVRISFESPACNHQVSDHGVAPGYSSWVQASNDVVPILHSLLAKDALMRFRGVVSMDDLSGR